jgi:hypothetical protein
MLLLCGQGAVLRASCHLLSVDVVVLWAGAVLRVVQSAVVHRATC